MLINFCVMFVFRYFCFFLVFNFCNLSFKVLLKGMIKVFGLYLFIYFLIFINL